MKTIAHVKVDWLDGTSWDFDVREIRILGEARVLALRVNNIDWTYVPLDSVKKWSERPRREYEG